jgi:hypothetical protein
MTTLAFLDQIEVVTVNLIKDKLRSLAKRKRNWDGQGGLPPTKETQNIAHSIVAQLITENRPFPQEITLNTLGGIVLDFGSLTVTIGENDVLTVVRTDSDKINHEVYDALTVPEWFDSI